MRRDYDIFEKCPDGALLWRVCVSGQHDAQRTLQDLAEHSKNEFVAIDIEAGELVPFILAHSDSREQMKNAPKQIA